jgi:hypothetical protein
VLLNLPQVSAALMFGVFFDPEDGGYMFLRNVRLVPNYTPRYNLEDHTLNSTAPFASI